MPDSIYCNQRGLRRHENADIATRTRLALPEHASVSGICSVCAHEGLCEIGRKAREGKAHLPEPYGTAQFGAEKRLTSLADLQVVPELFGQGQIFPKIRTEATIGGFRCSLPLAVAALGSSKVANDVCEAISSGTAAAGIPRVIGENILATYGKPGYKKVVDPYLQNYKKLGALVAQGNATEIGHGVFELAAELGCHAIEVKLGQGAKQNLGGEIRFESDADAEKYKKLGYFVVKDKQGYVRHAHPGDILEDGLRQLLIKKAELGLPIWVKIGIGRGILKLIALLDKVKKEQGVPLTCLTVDGFGGGTGLSPWLIMNETCVPAGSLFATLDKKPSFDILLAGGISTGADIAKVMMLGAAGASAARPFIIAATVDPKEGIPNYVEALKEEVQMFCASQRVDSAEKLRGRRQNLYALDQAAAATFGVSDRPKDVL